MKTLLFTLLFLVPALKAQDAELDKKKDLLEWAHTAVDPIRSNFKKSLKNALEKGGPEKALKECKTEAPKLAKGQKKSIEIGRTSLKIRNPKNAPREWVVPYLEKYSKEPREKHEKQVIVTLGPKHYGYLEPIYLEPMCMNCHGTDVSAGVKGDLKNFYPEDKAIGYKVGDFRGFFWLESRE